MSFADRMGDSFDPDFASPASWARMYRACGLQVVPGRPPDAHKSWKAPLLGWTGFQEELVPDFTFERWYGENGEYKSHANMGVIMGRCSRNAITLDLDIYKHKGAAEWWQGLLVLNTMGIEPETCEQRTGGGGRQLVFRAPHGLEIPNSAGTNGVDLRGQGGWVVCPPSMHTSGRAYEWLPGRAPWECDIAEAPDWLLRAIAELAPISGAHGPRERTASPGGDLNAFGAKVDGREEYMRDVVWAAVVDLARDCPIPPDRDSSLNRMLGAYDAYRRNVRPRLAGDPEDALEREGRGLSAFQDKWERAVKRWDDVLTAAKETPRAESDFTSYETKAETGEQPAGIKATPFKWVDPRTIPPREWIYDRHYIRRFVSTTVAPGGLGKSSLIIAEALAIATGRPLLGRLVDERVGVWYWNGEDPADELDRRIMATALRHKLKAEDFAGRLFVDTGRAVPIVIAERTRDGVVINAPLIEQVIKTITENAIGLMIVDPFIACHRVTENDNNEIERVAKAWAYIADVTGCAIELVHHVRKTGGNEVGVEDGRGAVALLSAARAARALNRMSAEEGAQAGVSSHRQYFRSDDGKANLAPPSERASWFQIVGFDLENATGTRPSDNVGVVEAWEWPDPLEGVTGLDMDMLIRRLGRNEYRADAQAAGWIGHVIIKELELGEGKPAANKAKLIQKIMLKNGALIEFEKENERRQVKTFVRVRDGV